MVAIVNLVQGEDGTVVALKFFGRGRRLDRRCMVMSVYDLYYNRTPAAASE